MRRLAQLAWLTGLWVVLWRDLSLANLASGVLVALLVTSLYPLPPVTSQRRPWRPLALLRFAAYFGWLLLVSNVVLARAILTPKKRLRTAIVAIPVGDRSDLFITTVANAITLTPGTMTLDVSDDRQTLYVHVLDEHDVEEVRQAELKLLRLALRAFGYDDAPASPTTTPTEEDSG